MANKSINRIKIIETTKTPLGFFTLIILVVEALLALLATKADATDFTVLLVSMIVLVFALVGVVLFTAIKRPEALTVGNPKSDTFDMEVRLVFDEKLGSIENIQEAVAYYQKLPKPFSRDNKLTVNCEEKNEAYVIVPRVRADDRIKVWLCHNDRWYATENVVANYRRLKFFSQESPEKTAKELLAKTTAEEHPSGRRA